MMKQYTPEEADKIIKARLAQFTAKGGKGGRGIKWSDEELELRDSIIISYLTENALSKYRTAQEIALRWGINISTAKDYVADAVRRWSKGYVEENDAEAKRVFLETLENLIQDSLAQGQKEPALKALDMISKVKGYYVNKQDVNVSANGKIEFNFGQDSSNNGD